MTIPEPTMERVFSLYGRAALGVHAFEVGILAIRVLLHATEQKKRMIRGRPPKEISLDAATCGDLLNQIQSKWSLPPGFQEHLTEYVRMRNHLVHQFYRKHNLDLLSDEGRWKMLAELAYYIAYFDTSLLLVEILRKELCRKLDWTEEQFARDLEQWLADDHKKTEPNQSLQPTALLGRG
jgi:hypothetical protein